MARRFATIHFIDGTKLSLSAPVQVDNLALMASRIQKSLESPTLALEAEGELIVIPTANIKYMQVHPAPERLPDSVIRGAKLEFD